MIPVDFVTHYVDEDWGPLCRQGQEGDSMWAFDDEQITCPLCRQQMGRRTA